MSLLSNEFDQLLNYLEKEKTSRLKSKEPIKKKSFTIGSKESASQETKKLIQNSLEGIHSDVKLGTPTISSRGFNVEKFEDLMRSKLIDEHKRMQSYERPYISVTEVLSCLRQKYYIRKKYKINVADQFNFSYLYMINKVGNCVHDIIQELYDHTEVEKTVLSEIYNVKGRVDGIRNNFVIEYKTIDEGKFNGAYIPIHYHQGLIYAYILNSEYGYKIDTITIVYILRNLKRIIPFDLPTDDKLAQQFLHRASILTDCLKNNIVPDPIASDDEQCKWCQYKEYCKQDPVKNANQQTKKENSKPVFLM